MSFIKIIFLSLVFLALQSCTNNLVISESEFDAITWKNDKKACQNKRIGLLEQFQKIIPKLKGVSEYDIRNLLGSPDNIELYRKHQKFYIYFIEPSGSCTRNSKTTSKKIYIRFNAILNVSEIIQKVS